MADLLDSIDPSLAAWLAEQPVFFVATAPLDAQGHVNVSPKGMSGTFAVIDDRTVAYLDLTGSGIETIAHLRENGRIVVMFSSFTGRPRTIRMHGTGRVVLPGTPEFAALLPRFTDHPGIRSIIVVDVTRTSTSCGWSVPEMAYQADRDILDLSHAKKGEEKIAEYRRETNTVSLDGLPGYPGS
jgi:hypothetical protein